MRFFFWLGFVWFFRMRQMEFKVRDLRIEDSEIERENRDVLEAVRERESMFVYVCFVRVG